MTVTSFYDTNGTNVIVLCTVELSPPVTESELSLLRVDAHLTHNGTRDIPTNREEHGTSFTYIAVVRSFQADDSGDYVCTATLSPLSPSPYITGNGTLTGMASASIGIQERSAVWLRTEPQYIAYIQTHIQVRH